MPILCLIRFLLLGRRREVFDSYTSNLRFSFRQQLVFNALNCIFDLAHTLEDTLSGKFEGGTVIAEFKKSLPKANKNNFG